jgi:hypothetical protein
MSKASRVVSTGLLSLALFTAAAPAALAAAPNAPAGGSTELRPATTRSQYVAAYKRWQKNNNSKDRKLLTKNKKAAKQIADVWRTRLPGRTVVTSRKGGKTCFKADYYWDYNTLLGSNAYEWHGILKYCIKKGKVVSAKPSEHIVFQNSFEQRGEAMRVIKKTALKKSTFSITLQGEVKNEIPIWGTWTTNHPTISYKVSGKNGKVKVGGHD